MTGGFDLLLYMYNNDLGLSTFLSSIEWHFERLTSIKACSAASVWLI